MTRPRLLVYASAVLGFFFGLALTNLQAGAARNAAGTYSLPTGNPVVAHTTATSTWANTTMSDLANEVTNSLDRNGRGCMLAPLPLASGTSSAPGLTFCSETNSGLYRAAAGDVRMQVAAATVEQWQSTGVTEPKGLTVTQSQSNASAITATGNGTGKGVTATGGGSSGAGVLGTGGTANGVGVSGVGAGSGQGVLGAGGTTNGAGGSFTGGTTNGIGVVAQGTGTGVGVNASGGTTSVGVLGTGGSSGSVGVQGAGTGTAAGGSFANGTAATGGTRQDAVTLANGDLNMSGAANPTSTTAITNRLTPANLPKAWMTVNTTGATFTCSIDAGFNVTSCARIDANTFRVTLASTMANANYVVTGTVTGFTTEVVYVAARTTTTFDIQWFVSSTGAIATLDGLTNAKTMILVFGTQ